MARSASSREQEGMTASGSSESELPAVTGSAGIAAPRGLLTGTVSRNLLQYDDYSSSYSAEEDSSSVPVSFTGPGGDTIDSTVNTETGEVPGLEVPDWGG